MPAPNRNKNKLKTSNIRPLTARLRRFLELQALISAIPESFLKIDVEGLKNDAIKCVYCDDYKKLIDSMRKALKWTPDLDYAFSVMLASISSTASVGDQLWIKLIAPASSGKSTLCEAVSVNAKYVLPKSTIRGFHSGFGDGVTDNSLISQVSGKTLVTKDGDTLLQSPNLSQILAEGRDVYDTVSRTSYRNKASKDYSGIRMTWILAGTNSLRSLDSSELGERFLDCVMMDSIDTDLENEILWRVVNRVEKNMAIEAGGSAKTQHDEAMLTAYELTGGYVDFLRMHSVKLLGELDVTKQMKMELIRLGKFVAYMRARPSRMQDESSERELASRLVSQLTRLSMCLAVVLNVKTLDLEVMKRTRRVALDTARGKTLEIVEALYESEDGLEVKGLSLILSENDGEIRHMLRFMRRIGIVELKAKKMRGHRHLSQKWFLTETLRELYESIMY